MGCLPSINWCRISSIHRITKNSGLGGSLGLADMTADMDTNTYIHTYIYPINPIHLLTTAPFRERPGYPVAPPQSWVLPRPRWHLAEWLANGIPINMEVSNKKGIAWESNWKIKHNYVYYVQLYLGVNHKSEP